MGQFFRSLDNAPLEFRIQHFQLPRQPVKLSENPGDCRELLRRSALGLENGVSSGSRVGAAWHYEDGKGFSLQLDLLPATTGKVVLPQLRPAKNFVLLSIRNGNHAADFVGEPVHSDPWLWDDMVVDQHPALG
jgi:hypothetical protein